MINNKNIPVNCPSIFKNLLVFGHINPLAVIINIFI